MTTNTEASPFLKIRVSRRDLLAHKPEQPWDINQYLPWLRKQAQGINANQLLFVLTAINCAGCTTLKQQLSAQSEQLSQTLTVLAEAGDLYGSCFFGISVGKLGLMAPGVPTAYLISLENTEVQVRAVSLGPLDRGSEVSQLAAFLEGTSRCCAEAVGVPIRVTSASKSQEVTLGELNSLSDFLSDF